MCPQPRKITRRLLVLGITKVWETQIMVNHPFFERRTNSTLSLRHLAVDFDSKFDTVSVSKDTVRKILQWKYTKSSPVVRKLLLTSKDWLKRLKWCRDRQDWTDNDWTTMIFTYFEVLKRKSRFFCQKSFKWKTSPKILFGKAIGWLRFSLYLWMY